MTLGPRFRTLPRPPPPTSKAAKAAAAKAVAAWGSSMAMAPGRKQARRPKARCAELAGGTAADCASVICCGPCIVMNFLVLTMVRIPAEVCSRAMRAQARRRAKLRKRKEERRLLRHRNGNPAAAEDKEEADGEGASGLSPEEMAKMEKEMWSLFHGAGFWRSQSQKLARLLSLSARSDGSGR